MNKIVLFLCFVPLITVAQNKKKIKKQTEPIAFINIYFAIQKNDLNVHRDFIWNTFYTDKKLHKSESSVCENIGIGFKINENSDLLIGLAYQKYKLQQISDFPLTYCDPIIYNAKEIKKSTRYVELNSLNMGIEYRYKIINKNRFCVYPNIGMNINFVLNKKQDITMLLDNGIVAYHKANKKHLEINKKVNISPFIKLGFRYQIIKPVYINIASFYSYQLGKEQILTETSNSNLFIYGLNLGIEYKIR